MNKNEFQSITFSFLFGSTISDFYQKILSSISVQFSFKSVSNAAHFEPFTNRILATKSWLRLVMKGDEITSGPRRNQLPSDTFDFNGMVESLSKSLSRIY